ncbi:urease accessory protein UreF [Actinomadura montaniterrae]|uniref:Urease accessory protein UreF n=1 Tax=Actinomadura montaniterrae TaxID=1803903 RepID=A0A6L3W008_9ACTN|nr:urease accessory UreF family protein [Actinomadura montaniterrae]KAB2388187.1 urease accessory protein UreF [Actinomadura montaniterrae]
MALPASLLLLADSRLPAGGHAHSGGLEPAAEAGAVTDLPTLTAFLRGRLATTGLVAAALSAAACGHAARTRGGDGGDGGLGGHEGWSVLDAETDARMPSPAGRRASRAQGRSLLRAVREMSPHPALDALAAFSAPHHPLVLGAAVAVTGGSPADAASIGAYGAVTGPASAAVRLLGLDPLAVHRALAELAPQVDAVAAEAAGHARGDPRDLPAASAPALDIFAELHLQANLRLFES